MRGIEKNVSFLGTFIFKGVFQIYIWMWILLLCLDVTRVDLLVLGAYCKGLVVLITLSLSAGDWSFQESD